MRGASLRRHRRRGPWTASWPGVAGEEIYALVNNAATLRDGHFLLMDPERWDVVIDTVLTGRLPPDQGLPAVRCFTPAAAASSTSGSLSGLLGHAGQANYAAAKGGLHAFTKALAREVGRFGVTVNAVVPGWIETDLVAASAMNDRARAIASVPLGRSRQAAGGRAGRGLPALGRRVVHHRRHVRVDGGVGS